jgi:hypothetical protein
MFKGESYKQGGGIMSNVGGVELEEFKDAKDEGAEDIGVMYTQEIIGEFEEVFHDAHDNYM